VPPGRLIWTWRSIEPGPRLISTSRSIVRPRGPVIVVSRSTVCAIPLPLNEPVRAPNSNMPKTGLVLIIATPFLEPSFSADCIFMPNLVRATQLRMVANCGLHRPSCEGQKSG
jgi:hypothetical protein